jgi:UrcA family protein
MTTSSLRIFCGGAVAAAMALALAVPAVAGAMPSDVTVSYADIDVDTAAGARQLLSRIEMAASKACAPLDLGNLSSRANRERCARRTTAATVARVNRPALVQAYDSTRDSTQRVAAVIR